MTDGIGFLLCSVSAKSPNDDKVDKMRKPSYDEKVRRSTNTGTDNKSHNDDKVMKSPNDDKRKKLPKDDKGKKLPNDDKDMNSPNDDQIKKNGSNHESTDEEQDSSLKCRPVHTNADSLINKRDELITNIEAVKPNIIAVTEVLPKCGGDNIQDVELELEDFDCFKLEGKGKRKMKRKRKMCMHLCEEVFKGNSSG